MRSLDKFIDLVRLADQSNQKEIRITLKDALNYSTDLSKLLIKYTESLEKSLDFKQRAEKAEEIDVEMDGGKF